MKKFVFALDKVLKYKEQVENNLRNEHATILKAISDEKKKLLTLENEFAQCTEKLECEKAEGCKISMIQMHETYLHSLTSKIKRVLQIIVELEAKEEKKIAEILKAKTETSSIDMIKEKRLESYNADLRRAEEHFIEEFVANTTFNA